MCWTIACRRENKFAAEEQMPYAALVRTIVSCGKEDKRHCRLCWQRSVKSLFSSTRVVYLTLQLHMAQKRVSPVDLYEFSFLTVEVQNHIHSRWWKEGERRREEMVGIDKSRQGRVCMSSVSDQLPPVLSKNFN